jgi:hypothetical protein
MEFEYINGRRNYADEVTYVNTMAKDGWELVTIVNIHVAFIYWFKRKIK